MAFLHDCIAKNAEGEIFIFSAESADLAREHRDRMTQAYLAVSDRVYNAEQEDLGDALSKPDVQGIIASLGVGIFLSKAPSTSRAYATNTSSLLSRRSGSLDTSGRSS